MSTVRPLPTHPEGPQPKSPSEVIAWFETGRLSPSEAFAWFRTFEHHLPDSTWNAAVPPAEADSEAARLARLEAVMAELDSLIGLDSVKSLIKELRAFIEIQKRRAQMKLAAEPTVLHMVFRGNPGTGKTTVARITGRMFKEMGVLPKGHMCECSRADLVGEYIGHTAQKTREQIKKAFGGVLFVDEAYALARGGEKDFGKEAIDTLVKEIEDHKNELVVILAGYKEEMADFLDANPGLRSRFPIHIDFPDYLPAELLKIAETMLRARDYELDPAARAKLRELLRTAQADRTHPSGNARLVRNLIERALRRQAVRLMDAKKHTRRDLIRILPEDLEAVNH
ncbi:MAG TPA: AAA family ATPase [Limnochordia bacterium]|nr:AAA family ATPase [Limnochordia bacterium]